MVAQMQNTPQPPHNPRPIAGTARRLLALFVTLVLCLNTLPTGAVAEAIDQAQPESSPLQEQTDTPALEPADDPDEQPETPAQSAPDEQPVQRIALAFDANMPVAEQASGSQPMAGIELVDGQTTTLPKNTFAREGYAFAGWSTTPDAAQDAVVTTDEQVLHGAAYELEVVRLLYDDGATRLLPAAAYDAHADAFTNVATERQTQSFDLATSAHDGALTLYAQWIALPATSDPTPATPEQTPAEKTDQAPASPHLDEPVSIAEETPAAAPANPATTGNSSTATQSTTPATPAQNTQNTTQTSSLSQALARAHAIPGLAQVQSDPLGTPADNLLQPEDKNPDLLTVQYPPTSGMPKDGEDVYLYNVATDTTGAIQITFSQEIFANHADKLTTLVRLPDYGMAFETGVLEDLAKQADIENASFIKDKYGNDTAVRFTWKETTTGEHSIQLATKAISFTPQQCSDIIDNGWHVSVLSMEVQHEDGTVVAEKDAYKMLPKADDYDLFSISPHEVMVSGDRRAVNADSSTFNERISGGYNLLIKDNLTLKETVLGNGDKGLVEIKQVKVYAPMSKIRLSNLGHELGHYNTWFILFTSDLVEHSDSKGTYFLLTPKARLFNNGPDDEIIGRFTWLVKDGDENRYIDDVGNQEYQAPDMEIVYRTPGSSNDQTATGLGFKITTLPVVQSDDFGFASTNSGDVVGYGTYEKKAAGSTEYSSFKVVPGAHYNTKNFVRVYNNVLAKNGTEYRVPPGNVTETFAFPWELRPTSITWRDNHSPFGSLEKDYVQGVKVWYEPIAGGDARQVTYDQVFYIGDSLDLTTDMREGERISKVEVNWASFMGSVGTFFDFGVTETHQDGTSLQKDELIQIGYSGVFAQQPYVGDTPPTFSTATSPQYLYVQVDEKPCPWLGYSDLIPEKYAYYDLTKSTEFTVVDTVGLKMPAGGSYRDWMEDPVLELVPYTRSGLPQLDASKNETALSFLSSFVVTPNMSGWTIRYRKFNTTTGQESEEMECPLGEVTSDRLITKGELGLSEDEFFTACSFYYDGTFVISQTSTLDQPYMTDDGVPSGMYDYAYLLKSINMLPRTTSFSGERLTTGSVDLLARITHEGTCDRDAHHDDSGEISKYYSGYRTLNNYLYSDYHYTIEGPNYSASTSTSSPLQGGTFVGTLNFPLVCSLPHKPTEYSGRMPADVPEAIYIELKDPNMTPDLSNAEFQQSLAAHGMSIDDVSLVEADGKRWIKLSTNGRTVAWKPKMEKTIYYPDVHPTNSKTMDFCTFTIALHVWEGHEIGETQPFGEVYYDISNYLTKYDGSEASEYRTVSFVGAVPDDHGLLGDGDTTTPRLWKATSDQQVKANILLSVDSIARILPGKGGVRDGVPNTSGSQGYVDTEKSGLFAALTIKAPGTQDTFYNYETVAKLPEKGDTVTYLYRGEEVTHTSDYALDLTGEAVVARSSVGNPGGVHLTYSMDGVTFVDAATASQNWGAYRYVKVLVEQIEKSAGLEVRIPVVPTDGYVQAAGGQVAYMGGTWSYQANPDGTMPSSGNLIPGRFCSAPSLSLPVTKQLKAPALLNGSGTYDHAYSFAAGAFSFTLSSVDGAPLPGGVGSMTQQVSAATVSTAANGTQTQTGGTTTFAGLEFDVPGTYTYQLREVIPPAAERLPGVEYNEHVETVTVTVTQDANGRLAARLATGSGGAVTFVNRYALPDTPVGIHAHAGAKTLVRYPGTDAQANAEHVSGFSFVLEERRGDSWVTKYTTAVNDDGSFSFTPLEFTQLDLDKGAPHVYRIREVVPPDAVGAAGVAYGSATETQRAQGGFTKNGITYDQTEYELTITLSDGGGKIDAAQSFVKVRDASGQALTGQTPFGTADGLRFSNTYAATGTAVVQATKDLAGRAWTDDDAFTFKLVPKYRLVGEPDEHGQVVVGTLDTNDPSPMPGGTAELTATATKQHHTTSFSAITFTADQIGKTYMYDVSEAMPASPEENMAYDPSDYGVAITPLRDKGDGTIEVYVSYALNVWNGDGTEDDEHVPIHGVPAFLNKSVGHGTANIFAEKDLEGRAWTAGDEFTFVLEADRVENADGDHIAVTQFPMPNAQGRTAIATADDESAEFGDIHYALADVGRTYYYTIREQLPDGAEGRTKNGITYSSAEQQVRVKVHALASDSTKVTADVEYQARTREGKVIWTREPLASFVNTYAAAPATVAEVQVRKLLKAPADLNETGDYDVTYPFDEGAFEFELTPGVNELGELAPMPADPENPEVPQKKIVARASAGLVDAAGRPVANSGMAAFEGAFTFDKVGRYVYVVREVVPAAATNAAGQTYGEHPEAEGPWMLGGTMYTTTAHNVFVDVTDDGMGQLRATVSSRAADGSLTTAPAEFTNRYHVADAPIVLDGTKTINGLAPGAGYTFRLERLDDLTGLVEQGAPVRYASSTADGTFAFSELVFPQTRLGKVTRYRVTEVVPEDAALSRVTYDRSAFEVAIRATDNGDGTMSLTASYERVADIEGQPVRFSVEGIEFVNRIIPAGTATLAVSKELRGRDWTGDDAFEFVAEDATPAERGAAPLPAADAVAKAMAGTPVGEAVRAEFGDIALEPGDAGRTLVYKLTERAGSQEGMTYSRQVYYATVDVVDEGDGTLSANVRYYRDAVDEANLLPDGEVPLYTNYQGLVPCRHDPPVRKVVKGSPAKPGTFEFTIVANDPSYPMMEGAKDGSKTVTQTGAGAVEFGEIEFTHPGAYEYTVTEKDTGAAGYTFDKSVWTVRYVVTEVDMHLVAERTFLKDGKQGDAMEATFTNVYAASGTPKQSGSTPGKAGTTPSASGSGGTRLASTGDATVGFVPLIALLGIALIRRGRRLAR